MTAKVKTVSIDECLRKLNKVRKRNRGHDVILNKI